MGTSLTGVPAAGGGRRLGSSDTGEANLLRQGAEAAYTAAATLVAGDLTGGIITFNAGAANLTLPTTASVETTVSTAQQNDAFDFCVLATGAGTATVVTATGWTLTGSMAVTNGTSGKFRARKTNASGASAWTLYRIA